MAAFPVNGQDAFCPLKITIRFYRPPAPFVNYKDKIFFPSTKDVIYFAAFRSLEDEDKGFLYLDARSIARMIAILGVVLGSLYSETSAESNVLSRRVDDAQVELISLKRRLPEDSFRTQLPDVQYLEFKSVYLEAKRYRKEHGNPAKTTHRGTSLPRGKTRKNHAAARLQPRKPTSAPP